MQKVLEQSNLLLLYGFLKEWLVSGRSGKRIVVNIWRDEDETY